MKAPERLYSLKEALPLLGIRRSKFYELLHAGRITAYHLDNKVIVPQSAISRYQREQLKRIEPRPAPAHADAGTAPSTTVEDLLAEQD